MTPSIEIRTQAAGLHETMTWTKDGIVRGEDRGETREWMAAMAKLIAQAIEGYEAFCALHGFRLQTDASGLCLYCAETGIPLVIGDEYDELETGECVLVKRAA